MSQWRLDVRKLYELGGEAPTSAIDEVRAVTATRGLQRAKLLGLVDGGGKQGGTRKNATWRLTPLGRAFAENRVEPAGHFHCGIKTWFKPTWLSSLPQGVRIAP
jgi:hypothetical protein